MAVINFNATEIDSNIRAGIGRRLLPLVLAFFASSCSDSIPSLDVDGLVKLSRVERDELERRCLGSDNPTCLALKSSDFELQMALKRSDCRLRSVVSRSTSNFEFGVETDFEKLDEDAKEECDKL